MASVAHFIGLKLRELEEQAPSELEREAALSTPFHLVPVFLGLGAVYYFAADSEPAWVSLTAAVFFLAVLRVLLRKSPVAIALNAALLISAGAFAAKLETTRHQQTMLAGELSTTITAQVLLSERTERGARVVLKLMSTREPELKHAPLGVRLSLPKSAPPLASGNIIEARARLQPPGGPVRPDGYDFAFHAWFSGIGAIGFSVGPVTVREGPGEVSLAQRLEQLRAGISERVRAVIGGEAGDVAAALITGVQAGISRETAEAMRVSGLAHVLSISGLHMALAAAIFLFGIRGAFALFPRSAQHVPVKKIAAALALLSCTFYLALSGAGVATVRSWIMIAVMLFAILLDRPALTMRNLAIAAIIILLIWPHEIMGPSFQLSFAATAALISAYAAYSGWRENRLRVTPLHNFAGKLAKYTGRVVGGAALTSLVAGLATTLFSLWHFNRLAPLGLPANLASMVPVSLIIMPSAVVAMLLMPFGLDALPLHVMGIGVKAMNAIAYWFASISPDSASKAMPLSAFLAGTVGLLILIVFQSKLRWLSIFPAFAAIVLTWLHSAPDVLISEDGKLVAVHTTDGNHAVNRRRMPQFAGQVWAQALGTSEFTSSKEVADAVGAKGFLCHENICRLTRNDGLRVVWQDFPQLVELAEDHPTESEAASPADKARQIEDKMRATFFETTGALCQEADILIINGPTKRSPCNYGSPAGTFPQIITSRELALFGSAEVTVRTQETTIARQIVSDAPTIGTTETHRVRGWTITIRHAIDGNRPWHRDRAFSRAVRNMNPFRPIRQKIEEQAGPPEQPSRTVD